MSGSKDPERQGDGMPAQYQDFHHLKAERRDHVDGLIREAEVSRRVGDYSTMGALHATALRIIAAELFGPVPIRPQHVPVPNDGLGL